VKEVIIFGIKDTAELACWYLKNDTDFKIAAFTINENYIKESTFKGVPVVPFEYINKNYSPKKYNLFAPMTGKNMNKNREKIFLDGKSKGYHFISYISSNANVLTDEIGENCFILEDNTIQPFTKIGNNVVLWSGNHIGHHSFLHDHTFFTSHVVLSGNCIVEKNCVLGVNSTVRDFTNLSKGTLLGMGSCLVIKSTEEWGVYFGNPAKKVNNKISYDVY
jgi:sugar O-acyltransferase (sialic acid O-acetyltransferase NeuD family)